MRGITWLIIIWTGFMAFLLIFGTCVASYGSAAYGSDDDAGEVAGYIFDVWFAIFVALSLIWIMTKMDEWMKQDTGQPVSDADSPEEPAPPPAAETSEDSGDKTPRFQHFDY